MSTKKERLSVKLKSRPKPAKAPKTVRAMTDELRTRAVVEYLKPGASTRSVARLLGCSHMAVHRALKREIES